MVSKVFTFLAFAYLARVLGPDSFGALEFTLAVMVFLALFVDFGSSPYGAREVAREPSRTGELLANIVRQRLALAVAIYSLVVVVALSVSLDPAARTLLLVYGLTLLLIPAFVQWVFQGHDRMHWVALGSIVRWTTFAAGVFIAIRHERHLWRVGLVECAAVLAFAAFNLYILSTRFRDTRPRVVRGSLRRSFREALPIGLSELTWASTWYFATVLVGILLAGEQVGWFGAAHRPVMTLHTFVWLYFYNLLPSLSRCVGQPPAVLRRLLDGSFRITAWAGALVALTGTLLAEPIITLVFGAQYLQSVPVFRVLVWVLPVALVSGHYRYALIAFGRQKYEFYCSAAGAAASIALGAFLVPAVGIVGAAIALLVSSVVNLALALALAASKVGPMPFLAHLVRPAVACVAATVVFSALRVVHLGLAGVAALSLYAVALLALDGEIRRPLFALLRPRP